MQVWPSKCSLPERRPVSPPRRFRCVASMLVFTGGIGEHAGRVRSAIVDRLAVVGLGPIASDETGED